MHSKRIGIIPVLFYKYCMNVIECTDIANTTVSKNRKIKYIVIHYTAGTTSKPGTAKSTAKYFAKETTKASADYIVDDENVVQYNPDIKNRYTWHCGGSKYKTRGGSLYKICTSANSIGIEMCSTNSTKKVTAANDANWYFTDAVISNTLELVKQLMDEYDIDFVHVVRHYDVNGKPCPGVVGWNEDTSDITKWEHFKLQLLPTVKIEEENLEEIVEETKKPEEQCIATVIQEQYNAPTEKSEKIEKKSENISKISQKTSIFMILLNTILALFKK